MTPVAAQILAVFDDILDVELPPSTARPEPIEGSPRESDTTLFEDDVCVIGVWECTPGVFGTVKDGIGEHCMIACGDGTLHGDDGSVVELRPGASFVMPEGFSGRWEIRETVRKQFTIWKV